MSDHEEIAGLLAEAWLTTTVERYPVAGAPTADLRIRFNGEPGVTKMERLTSLLLAMAVRSKARRADHIPSSGETGS